MRPPSVCPSKKIKPCKGKTFRHMTELQQHTDVQEIRLQENADASITGSAARAINVIVQDELVDTCQAGGREQNVAFRYTSLFRRDAVRLWVLPKHESQWMRGEGSSCLSHDLQMKTEASCL